MGWGGGGGGGLYGVVGVVGVGRVFDLLLCGDRGWDARLRVEAVAVCTVWSSVVGLGWLCAGAVWGGRYCNERGGVRARMMEDCGCF